MILSTPARIEPGYGKPVQPVFPTVAQPPLIAFRGDSFKRTIIQLDGRLEPAVAEALKSFDSGKTVLKELGYGYQARAYSLEIKGPEHPHGLVVKTSHDKTFINDKGEYINAGNTFVDENEAIKMFWQRLPQGFRHLGSIKTIALAKNENGRHFLVINKLLGKEVRKLSASNDPIKPEHLEKMLEDLYMADVAGLYHKDLNWKNVLFDEKNGLLNIIDYEAFRGFNPLELEKNAQELHFPEFCSVSNIRKFEDKTLMNYLRELSETANGNDKAKSLFRKYLRMRAKFHEKKADHLAAINVGNKLNAAIEYEKLHAKLFSYINDSRHKEFSDDLCALEFAKINVTHVTELRYSKNYPGFFERYYEAMHTNLLKKKNIQAFRKLIGKLEKKYSYNPDMMNFLSYQTQYANSMKDFSLKVKLVIRPFEMVTRVAVPGRFKNEGWSLV